MTEQNGEEAAQNMHHDDQLHEESGNDPSGSGREIMLQGFNWECNSLRGSDKQPCWLQMLAAKAHEMADAGITAVWLPPPCHSLAPQGYMPQDLESLSTEYGSEADARTYIKALHAHSIKAIADIVINHRCAREKGPDGKWNQYTGKYPWDAHCICSNEADKWGGLGEFKQEAVWEGAPNIDHSQERVQTDVKQWLSWLRQDVGFDGFRWDYSKGYKGAYIKEYVEAAAPVMAVGEFWTPCVYDPDGKIEYNQDPHRQQTVDWCDATAGHSAAFDFTTKGVLQEAVSTGQYWRLRDGAGKPPGIIGWWPSRAVTFIENHDTGSTQRFWPFPEAGLAQGYAYILTHPGTPCLFYDHLWSDGGRRALGIWGSLKRLLSQGSVKTPLSHQPSLESQPSASGGEPGAAIERVSASEPPQPLAALRAASSSSISRRKSKQRDGALSAQQLRSTILELVQLRRRAGLHCRSKVTIVAAEDGLYAATIDAKVAVKLGPTAWSPDASQWQGGGCWVLACSGVDWAAWELQPSEGRHVPRGCAQPIPIRS